MTIATAVQRISEIAEMNGEQFLETLMYMQDHLDEFSKEDRCAFRTVMVAGQAMFAPLDTAAA